MAGRGPPRPLAGGCQVQRGQHAVEGEGDRGRQATTAGGFEMTHGLSRGSETRGVQVPDAGSGQITQGASQPLLERLEHEGPLGLEHGDAQPVELPQRQLDGAVTVYPNYFDQRHNLNLVLSYQLPRGWRVGGRLRLSSGIPYTPIVGSHELAGVNIPIFGPPSSARYPWFHQLDLRVDKRWLLKRASVTLYLDIQNVYGGQPVELYSYSADFKQRQGMPVLPILPVLGLRVDY